MNKFSNIKFLVSRILVTTLFTLIISFLWINVSTTKAMETDKLLGLNENLVIVYNNDNIHEVFMSQKGEDIEFSVNKELFEPDENGMLHNIYVKCMLWDKNLVPLCKNILLI